MTHTIHLLKDLGIYKSSLSAKFYRDFGDRQDDDAMKMRELLNRRTQTYTLDEAAHMANYLSSSHDGCVTDNPDDYSAIEVYTATRNEKRDEEVSRRIKQMRAEEATV